MSILVVENFADSDLGALAEKVIDGQTGRLFPAGDVDALAALLQEMVAAPAQLESLRSAITPPPTVADHAAQLVDIYAGLLVASR